MFDTNESSNPSNTDASVSTSAASANDSATGNLQTETDSQRADYPQTPGDVWNAPVSEREDANNPEKAEDKSVEPSEATDEENSKITENPPEKDADDEVLEEIFAKKEDEPKDESADTIKSLPTKQARAWASRRDKLAKPMDAFVDATKPIQEAVSQLENLHPARFAELQQTAAYSLIEQVPDAAFKRLYVSEMLKINPDFDYQNAELPTLSDILQTNQRDVSGTNAPLDFQTMAESLNGFLGHDFRDTSNDENLDNETLELVTNLRAYEKQLTDSAGAKSAAEQEKDKELARLREIVEGVQRNQETVTQARQRETYEKTVTDFRSQFEGKLLPHVAKINGLKIDEKNDTPEIKGVKETLSQLLYGTEYERAHNYPSQFEFFASNASSVSGEIKQVQARLAGFLKSEADARLVGKEEEAAKFRALANDEKPALFNLFAKANDEFKDLWINPIFGALGALSSNLANTLTEASKRIEIVNNGETRHAPPPTDFSSSEEVWDDMAAQATHDLRLRANS